MLIRKLADCDEIIAGDKSRLRELLHPERVYSFAGRYSLAQALVKAGQATLKHRLLSDEVYYILSGQGIMHVDRESEAVAAGDVIEIRPGSVQWIENVGRKDLIFLCIVDPAWNEADEEIL